MYVTEKLFGAFSSAANPIILWIVVAVIGALLGVLSSAIASLLTRRRVDYISSYMAKNIVPNWISTEQKDDAVIADFIGDGVVTLAEDNGFLIMDGIEGVVNIIDYLNNNIVKIVCSDISAASLSVVGGLLCLRVLGIVGSVAYIIGFCVFFALALPRLYRREIILSRIEEIAKRSGCDDQRVVKRATRKFYKTFRKAVKQGKDNDTYFTTAIFVLEKCLQQAKTNP